jgi:hypothetical protein
LQERDPEGLHCSLRYYLKIPSTKDGSSTINTTPKNLTMAQPEQFVRGVALPSTKVILYNHPDVEFDNQHIVGPAPTNAATPPAVALVIPGQSSNGPGRSCMMRLTLPLMSTQLLVQFPPVTTLTTRES